MLMIIIILINAIYSPTSLHPMRLVSIAIVRLPFASAPSFSEAELHTKVRHNNGCFPTPNLFHLITHVLSMPLALCHHHPVLDIHIRLSARPAASFCESDSRDAYHHHDHLSGEQSSTGQSVDREMLVNHFPKRR